METLNLYAKQDGLYETLDILITYNKTNDLPQDWYWIENGSFKELVKVSYHNLFDVNCQAINVNLEDTYSLSINDIKTIIPEEMF